MLHRGEGAAERVSGTNHAGESAHAGRASRGQLGCRLPPRPPAPAPQRAPPGVTTTAPPDSAVAPRQGCGSRRICSPQPRPLPGSCGCKAGSRSCAPGLSAPLAHKCATPTSAATTSLVHSAAQPSSLRVAGGRDVQPGRCCGRAPWTCGRAAGAGRVPGRWGCPLRQLTHGRRQDPLRRRRWE